VVTWRVLGFRSSVEDETVIRSWYIQQGKKEKAKFNVTLEFLVQRPRHEWSTPVQNPRFKLLHPPLDEFGEIRFEVRNVQHRPIGFFSNGNEFTILEFAIEKDGRLPNGLQSKLEARRLLVLGDKRRYTNEWRVMV